MDVVIIKTRRPDETYNMLENHFLDDLVERLNDDVCSEPSLSSIKSERKSRMIK